MLPKTPLLLISNRDEFYARPTLPLHACDGIIAGRDKQAGGTWMGVNLSGRWAVLTNFRDGQDKNCTPPRMAHWCKIILTHK